MADLYFCDGCFEFVGDIEEYTDPSALHDKCLVCGLPGRHHVRGSEWHYRRIIVHMARRLEGAIEWGSDR